MSLTEKSFDQLLVNIEDRERTARKRAVIYTAVPVVMAIALLSYTTYRITTANNQLNDIKTQATEYKGKADEYQAQTNQLKNQIAPLNDRISGYRSQVEDYQKNVIPGLDSQVRDLKTQTGGYEAQLGKLRGDISGLRQQYSGLDTRNKELTTQNASLATNNVTLKSGNEELTTENVSLAADNTTLARTNKDLQEKLKVAEARLKEGLELGRFVHTVDFVDAKMIMVRYGRAADVFLDIMQTRTQGVSWHLGGRSPAEGFDSPSFATFILEKRRLLSGSIDAAAPHDARRDRLRELLKPATKPEMGDIVFYPAGYALFYFVDEHGPFVIGMTPFGITALNYDFATPIAFGHVAY